MSAKPDRRDKTTAAIILAAGEGTRMKSGYPKVLHGILGVPMIFRVVQSVLALGSIPVTLVTGHGNQLVSKEINKRFQGKNIRFALQSQRLGTGHAVQTALKSVPPHAQEILVTMGDMPLISSQTYSKLIEATRKNKTAITVATATMENPAGLGRIMRAFSGKLIGIREDRDSTGKERAIREINAGVYCFSGPFLRSHINRLSNKNSKREYYLTDLIEIAASNPSGPVESVSISPEEARGINDRNEIAEAENILLRKVRARLMREGVSIIMPETVYIEESVTIAPDTVVEPRVILKGKTSIGRGCRIGAGSIIIDATIAGNIDIEPYCVIEKSNVTKPGRISSFERAFNNKIIKPVK
ncbi:MAG: NTP transferase domain-containing protein [Pseudomonadota bacterium]